MRNLLSALGMALSAMLMLVAIAGFQVNQLLREEEPIRDMLGSLPQQEEFTSAIANSLVEGLTQQLPDQLSGLVPEDIGGLFAGPLESVMDTPQTQEAWDEVLQDTRESYDQQLLALFDSGTSYDPAELRVSVDLSPLTEAVSQPLRDGLDNALGWLPGIDPQSFDWLAPELVIDIDAVTEDGVDPYSWATAAALSQYWLIAGAISVGLAAIALLLGRGRLRWVWLAMGSLILALGALGIGITFGSLDIAMPAEMPQLNQLVIDHIAPRYSAWMQPVWWFSAGIAGAATLLAAGLAVVAPRQLRR